MPEEKTTETEAQNPEGLDTGNTSAPSETTPDNEPQDLEAEVAKWRELARKHEKRSKENYEKVKAFDELQEQQMSEAEKAAKRAEKAESEAAELRTKLALNDALVKHGLTAEDGELLKYVPVEEIDAAAARMASRVRPADPGKTTPADGAPAGGSSVTSGNVLVDIKNIDEQIAEARSNRDFTKTIQLQNERAALVRKAQTAH